MRQTGTKTKMMMTWMRMRTTSTTSGKSIERSGRR
jgi:hypothetical protein